MYDAVAYQQYVYGSGEVASCLFISKARFFSLKINQYLSHLFKARAVLGLQLVEKITGALQMEIKSVVT